MLNNERIEKLKKQARETKIDCLLLVPGVNLYYLSGLQMTVSERIMLVGIPVEGELFAIAPLLESERITKTTGIKNIYSYPDEQGPLAAANAALRKKQVLGVEFRYMRILEHDLLNQCLGETTIRNIDPILAGMRAKKDRSEQEIMQKAAQIADQAIAAGINVIKPGINELEVTATVLTAIRRFGASGELAVAAGKNSAIPHAHSSDNIIKEGDAVWIDIVVKYESYVADITRTCFAGKPDAEMKKIFSIVHDAQEIGRTRSKPGMTGSQVDSLCRDHIVKNGYGDFFIHRTGHGIGLEVHEEPYIVNSNQGKLEPDMTFTIEPGIYLPGKDGIRIEDDIILTEDGARSLTAYDRELLII